MSRFYRLLFRKKPATRKELIVERDKAKAELDDLTEVRARLNDGNRFVRVNKTIH